MMREPKVFSPVESMWKVIVRDAFRANEYHNTPREFLGKTQKGFRG